MIEPPPKRRARPNRKKRIELAALAREAKEKRKELRAQQTLARREAAAAALAAAEAAKIEAKKKELATFDNAKAELLRTLRPQSVTDYCRSRGIDPDTVPWHPRYNIPGVPPEHSQQAVECICFGKDWPAEYGGLGAFRHLENYIRITYPEVQWNDWLTRMMRSLTDADYEVRLGETRLRFVSWVGAGAAGKTFAAGLFASCWFEFDYWFGRPRSSVTLTSTSKSIIAQRVWPVIQKCYHDARNQDGTKLRWGHLVDSKKQVQYEKGDEKHSICALAVEPGDLQGALDKIKGRHTERMLVIIDEANSTPQAIWECIPNMLTGVRELVVLVIGNAGSRLDPHGRCCEPKRGWKSITIEDEQWETKGVEQWGIGPGVCLHFDGAKSPNVIAGKTEHRHIYSFERWQQVLRMGDEYRNTLQHWSQDRGFWPPDGLQTTVFTEALVISKDGMGEFHWIDVPKPYAALDPAFGGDDCVLQRGLVGMVRGPKLAIQLTEWRLAAFDPDSPDPIDTQIARYVLARCKEWGVEPEHFGVDSTGTGRGVLAILRQMWSPQVKAVEFGGAASELPASVEDPRASKEVYGNKISELWYACRDLLQSGQLRGLSEQAVKEFCSRTYFYVSRRYCVEPKRDMRSRLGYSPDHADAVAILCDVARQNGLVAAGDFAGQGKRPRNQGSWEDAQRDIAALTESSYSAGNDFQQYVEVN